MSKANPTLIGAFLVGTVVLVIIVIVIFGSGRLAETIEWKTYFRGSVSGLSIGAPVQIRGVPLGTVTEITGLLDASGDVYVGVLLELRRNSLESASEMQIPLSQEDIEKLIVERGLRAQLATQSFVTGQLYVRLDYFPDSPLEHTGFDKNYPEMPSIPTNMEQLESQIRDGLASLGDLPVEDVLDATHTTLSTINSLVKSPEVKGALVALTNTLQTVDNLLGSSEVKDTIVALKNTLHATEKVATNLDSRIQPMTDSILRTSDAAGTALEKAEELESKIIKELDAFGELSIDQTLDSMRTALTEIEGLVGSPEVKDTIVALKDAVEATEKLATNLNSQVEPMVGSVKSAFDAASASLQRTEELLLRANNIAGEDRYEFTLVLKELAAAGRALRVLADTLERNPSALIFGK